jgi:hypothetical protein
MLRTETLFIDDLKWFKGSKVKIQIYLRPLQMAFSHPHLLPHHLHQRHLRYPALLLLHLLRRRPDL